VVDPRRGFGQPSIDGTGDPGPHRRGALPRRRVRCGTRPGLRSRRRPDRRRDPVRDG
jgi:hypothetical protein